MKNWLIATGIALTLTLTLTASATAQTKTADAKGKKPVLTCPVSGETIENLSKAPRYTYKGKTYYFCCKDCLNKFKASPATYLNRKPTKANNQKQQAGKACCSSEQGGGCSDKKGEQASGKSCCSDKLGAAQNGNQTAENKKTNGNTKQAAEQEPAQNAKLFCPVSKEEITPDEAIAFEYNGKRYYVCCSKCKQKFLADPETYAKKAEQLSPLQGKPVAE